LTTDASKANSSLADRDFARILLIKPSSLGDIVHALPVLRGLRLRYPRARIDWLVAKSCADLLAGHPDIAELVAFDRRRFGRLGRSFSAGVEFWRFLTSLRGRRYDLAIDLQGLFRSGFLAFASGSRVRVGFADARESAWIFYTHRISVRPSVVHAAERNYRVARMLGFDHTPMTFDLALTDPERRRGTAILAAVGRAHDEPFAAVLPGARWATKRWFPERFAEVIDRLATEHHLRTVLMGSPDERAVCETIAGQCRSRPIDLAGRTGLREMTAILTHAAVVVCHDSAPMHLAAAEQRPMVCIVGPTDPARTGPYGTNATILQADLPCIPCYLRRLSQCRFNHLCMRNLSVVEVVRAVAVALQEQASKTDKRAE